MCASACSNRRLTSALTSSLSLSCDSSHSTRCRRAMCCWSLSQSLTSASRSWTRDSATSSRKDCNSSSKTRLRLRFRFAFACGGITRRADLSLVYLTPRSWSAIALFRFPTLSCLLPFRTRIAFSPIVLFSRDFDFFFASDKLAKLLAIFWYMFRSSFASNKRPANIFFNWSSEARANRNDNQPTVLNLLVSYIVNKEKPGLSFAPLPPRPSQFSSFLPATSAPQKLILLPVRASAYLLRLSYSIVRPMKRRISGGNISPEFTPYAPLPFPRPGRRVADPKSVLSSSQALSQQIDKMRRKLVEIHSYVLFSFQAKIKLLFVHFHRVAEKRIFLRLHALSALCFSRSSTPSVRAVSSPTLFPLSPSPLPPSRPSSSSRCCCCCCSSSSSSKSSSSRVLESLLPRADDGVPESRRYRLVKQHLRRVKSRIGSVSFARPSTTNALLIAGTFGRFGSWRRRVDVLSRHIIVVSTLLYSFPICKVGSFLAHTKKKSKTKNGGKKKRKRKGGAHTHTHTHTKKKKKTDLSLFSLSNFCVSFSRVDFIFFFFFFSFCLSFYHTHFLVLETFLCFFLPSMVACQKSACSKTPPVLRVREREDGIIMGNGGDVKEETYTGPSVPPPPPPPMMMMMMPKDQRL